ncbi:hypothetical protein FRB95_001247, partial [Tulasnella sp. JGI-2019a]
LSATRKEIKTEPSTTILKSLDPYLLWESKNWVHDPVSCLMFRKAHPDAVLELRDMDDEQEE